MMPEHYARDVVERCEHLIESLLPVVMRDADRRFGDRSERHSWSL
jgi:hypothetical protein